jgi:hypothetical protein
LRNLITRLPPPDQRLLVLAWGLDGVEVPRPELARLAQRFTAQPAMRARPGDFAQGGQEAAAEATSVDLPSLLCRQRKGPADGGVPGEVRR